jgi:hypothetical protein
MCWVMPPGLAGGDIGLAQRVEQRGLAVVDMAHDGDDGRARLQVRIHVGRALDAELDIALADPLTRWPNSCTTSSAVSASMLWVSVAMTPMRNSAFTTSPPRAAMRLASSWTVMVSGRTTSRTTRSVPARRRASSCWRRSRSRARRMLAMERLRSSSPSIAACTSMRPPRRSAPPRLFLTAAASGAWRPGAGAEGGGGGAGRGAPPRRRARAASATGGIRRRARRRGLAQRGPSGRAGGESG